MATVKITITDARDGITTVIEADPEFPLDEDNDPILEQMTPAQAFALGALIQFSEQLPGNMDWRVFLR